MRILVTQRNEDGSRFKSMVADWEESGPLAPSQVRTKTLYSGVTNGTERNDLLRGNYCKPDDMLPAPWGYQNVGEVIEVGSEVTRLRVGDVVYSSADHVEYAVFDEDFLYIVLPPEFDRKEAALLGMASVAMHTCRNADIRVGEHVLVVGGGIIGQTAAQIANAMGARVDLCDINEERLTLAREIGAAEQVHDVSGDGWADHITDFTYDVVIDVAGAPGIEDRLVAAATHRGRVMLIAGRHSVCYDFNEGQRHEICIKQNSHFDNSDLANLCRLVARGQVTLAPYVRDVVPVEEAQAIYDKLRDTPQELLGTVFVW